MDKQIEYLFDERYSAGKDELRSGILRYRCKTIKAGPITEVEVYPVYARAMKRRAKKCKPTGEAQQRVNARNAQKKVERLMNANFDEGDLWGTFGWDDVHLPKSMEEAQKQVGNFLSRLAYARKKKGLPPMKYIYTIEHSEKWKIRYHVHIVMSGGLSRDEVEKKWKGGCRPQARRLQPDEDGLIGLARYITKSGTKERKMGFSRNLRQPEVSVADKKISFRRVEKMASDETIAADILKKLYPGYIFRGAEVPRSSAYIPGVYLGYRLRKKC